MVDATELSEDISKLDERIKQIWHEAEQRKRLFADERYQKLVADGYDQDAALEALQIIASSVIVGEVPDENLRLALYELASRIESLDDWMSAGGKLPGQWRVNR